MLPIVQLPKVFVFPYAWAPDKALDAEISTLEIKEQTASLAGTSEQGLERAKACNCPFSLDFLMTILYLIIPDKVWKFVCLISQGTGLFS